MATERLSLGATEAGAAAAGTARLLFIPVSGPRGMGEYAGSGAIAKEAVQRWPALQVHFALSRAAPYAPESPFPTRLLPSSPTFHTLEVRALIEELRPTIVIFDNAGRTAQLRAAVRSGARVIFISSRRRQRHKAFRFQCMALIAEHWIAYPRFLAGSLTAPERLKLALRGRPKIRYLDALLPAPDAPLAAALMRRLGLRPGEYILVVPGGGTPHPGAEDAPREIAAAALGVARHGYPTVLVGAGADGGGEGPALRTTARLPGERLARLLRQARLVISNGGDTLLQALSCRRPCIAVPIARDQQHRIDCCAEAGLVVRGKLDARSIESEALALLEGRSGCATLEQRLGGRPIRNDLDH